VGAALFGAGAAVALVNPIMGGATMGMGACIGILGSVMVDEVDEARRQDDKADKGSSNQPAQTPVIVAPVTTISSDEKKDDKGTSEPEENKPKSEKPDPDKFPNPEEYRSGSSITNKDFYPIPTGQVQEDQEQWAFRQ
jgi:hypothetical protein